MHETADDLDRLQALPDRSIRAAGQNLRDIHGQGASELCERLQGPRWVVIATVNSDGRPFTAQADGAFYRGRFYFGVNDRHSPATPTPSPSLPSSTAVYPLQDIAAAHRSEEKGGGFGKRVIQVG